jgi:hypothetical protein
MNREDRNWELAGQARMDGDREAERMYTNRARGLPDDYVPPPPCPKCHGSGWDWYPYAQNERCKVCGGTGRRR